MVDLRPMKVSSFSAIVDMVAIDESIVTPTTFGATERTQPWKSSKEVDSVLGAAWLPNGVCGAK